MLDIIRPTDPRYPAHRHTYTTTGSPAAIARVRNIEDLAPALSFARAQGVPFVVRSGGHGISSVSTNDGGTVIDLSALDDVERLDGTHVRIGPGARWGQVARILSSWGLALTSGDSGDVGVGGLATAGGIGLLGRHQGLTIDRIRAVDLLTADGELRRVDAEHHPELFWAVRGAGAQVGIVTAFEFEAGTTPVVAHATIAFSPADLQSFLREWGTLVEQAPRIVSAFLYAGGSFAQAMIVVATDDEAHARAALAPFTALPGVVGARAEMVPYPQVPLSSGAPHVGQQTARMRSGLFTHLGEEASAALAELAAGGQMIQIRSAGGAINNVAPTVTAYPHRHQNFSVAAMASPRGTGAGWEKVRELRDGAYLSFQSRPQPDDVRAAYPEPTLTRLRAIKQQWDPETVFDHGPPLPAPGTDLPN